jgi:hypothetical protein
MTYFIYTTKYRVISHSRKRKKGSRGSRNYTTKTPVIATVSGTEPVADGHAENEWFNEVPGPAT